MKLFWKIFLAVFVTFFLIVSLVSYIISTRQVTFADTAGYLKQQNVILGQFITREIEQRQIEGGWPFESLHRLAERKDCIFWWIVRNDGMIHLASDSGYIGTAARDYLPEISKYTQEASRDPQHHVAHLFPKKQFGLAIHYFKNSDQPWYFAHAFSLREAHQVRKKIFSVGFAVVIGAMMLLAALLLLIIGHFVDPIEKLTRGTEVIGKGHLDFHVDINSKDELGHLGEGFNKMANELRETTVSRKFVDSILETILEALFVVDPRGKILTVNKAASELTGYQRDELLQISIERFLSPDINIFRGQPGYPTEGLYSHKNLETLVMGRNGQEIPVLLNVSPMTDQWGKVTNIVCTVRDISERKHSEAKLRVSEMRLRQIVENMPVMMLALDENGKVIIWNRECERITGYRREEVIHDPEIFKRLSAHKSIDFFTGGSWKTTGYEIRDLEWTIICKGGEIRTISYSNISHRFPIEGWSSWGIGVDISKRKRAEEALQRRDFILSAINTASEGFLRTFPIQSDDILAVLETLGFNTDVSRIYIFENQRDNEGVLRTTQKFEWTSTDIDPQIDNPNLKNADYEAIGMSRWKHRMSRGEMIIGNVRDFPKSEQGLLILQDIKSIVIVPIFVRDKWWGFIGFDECRYTRQWHELEIEALKTVGAILGALFERYQSEAALDEVRKNLQRLFDSLDDFLFIVDKDGFLIDVNPMVMKRLGYSRPELKNMPLSNLHPLDRRQEAQRVIEQIRAGETNLCMIPLMAKNGDQIPVETKVTPGRWGGEEVLFGISRDLTERLKAEKEKIELQHQLRQSQKMEAIGTLAGGIAHDFNNILTAVMGFAEMTASSIHEPELVATYTDEVLSAAERARDLVRQILIFSRQDEQELRPLMAKPIIKEVLKFLRAGLPSFIEMQQDIQSDAMIMGDPTQLHQVVMNICTNAAQAMEETGGMMEISLTDETPDSELQKNYPDFVDKKAVKLTVRDTGHGMTPLVLERIFEPFYTTKEKGKGTGMGLSVAHGIVRSWGGMISASSQPKQGTTITVMFPAMAEEKSQREEKPTDPPKGSERILLVDDENIILIVGANILRSLGYEVFTTVHAEVALDLIQEAPHRFDLLITDMTMPHMTGEQLARKVLGIRPEMPIILCTGYSSRITANKAKAIGIKSFLEKPLNKVEIATEIRRVLDAE